MTCQSRYLHVRPFATELLFIRWRFKTEPLICREIYLENETLLGFLQWCLVTKQDHWGPCCSFHWKVTMSTSKLGECRKEFSLASAFLSYLSPGRVNQQFSSKHQPSEASRCMILSRVSYFLTVEKGSIWHQNVDVTDTLWESFDIYSKIF